MNEKHTGPIICFHSPSCIYAVRELIDYNPSDYSAQFNYATFFAPILSDVSYFTEFAKAREFCKRQFRAPLAIIMNTYKPVLTRGEVNPLQRLLEQNPNAKFGREDLCCEIYLHKEVFNMRLRELKRRNAQVLFAGNGAHEGTYKIEVAA